MLRVAALEGQSLYEVAVKHGVYIGDNYTSHIVLSPDTYAAHEVHGTQHAPLSIDLAGHACNTMRALMVCTRPSHEGLNPPSEMPPGANLGGSGGAGPSCGPCTDLAPRVVPEARCKGRLPSALLSDSVATFERLGFMLEKTCCSALMRGVGVRYPRRSAALASTVTCWSPNLHASNSFTKYASRWLQCLRRAHLSGL